MQTANTGHRSSGSAAATVVVVVAERHRDGNAEPVARRRRASASLRIALCLLPAPREDILTSYVGLDGSVPIYDIGAIDDYRTKKKFDWIN